MTNLIRHLQNPIFVPNKNNIWEKEAVFNGCVIKDNNIFHLVYRAVSSLQTHHGIEMRVSSIGHATSKDATHFTNRRQLIKPEYDWEAFGCEDPRVTKLDGKHYIFYTALSAYPFSPAGIKIGAAITRDFKSLEEKHPVTTFNSKAMALFPERINGKIVAVLTVNTDVPPAKIALAFFDEEFQIWSREYWQDWLASLDTRVIPLLRTANDHMEVGAPPVKTKDGWLLIYSYIKNYFASAKIFGIEAALLDLKDPLKIIGRTTEPLLVPEEEYEIYDKVPNVIFPSGALVQNGKLFVYYGAVDTTCCLAKVDLKSLVKEMTAKKQVSFLKNGVRHVRLKRYKENPIIQSRPENSWESKGTFNPAAIYEGGRVHIIYRAFSEDHTSTLGYALSSDGIHIDERLAEPIYVPREDFEKKAAPGVWSGCEDPRITKIGDRFFMCYTAYDGVNPTRAALTSIKVKDFLSYHWNWEKPILISPPGIAVKNSCILSEKINGQYVIFYRIYPCIWIDFVKDLNFRENNWLKGKSWFKPRTDKWDSRKVGIGAPPIKTKEGWLSIYHGISEQDRKYRVGAMLLGLKNPSQVLARPNSFILEPEENYEKGEKDVVFPCGAVVIKGRLFVYYGGADKVVGVATANINEILEGIKKFP